MSQSFLGQNDIVSGRSQKKAGKTRGAKDERSQKQASRQYEENTNLKLQGIEDNLPY